MHCPHPAVREDGWHRCPVGCIQTGGPHVTNDDIDEQAVFEALADPECRTILERLTEPMTAQEIIDACELPQTSCYRKLDHLVAADLVEKRTNVRTDGHHTTAYVRNCSGVFVALEGSDSFEPDLLREPESAEERLGRFWALLSEQL